MAQAQDQEKFKIEVAEDVAAALKDKIKRCHVTRIRAGM
jgi:hypothetical protein